MIHEDEVLKKHPEAREFRPVKPLISGLWGWTFEVPAGQDRHLKRYGWVTCDGEVSSDTLQHRDRAEKNLRTYVRSLPAKATAQPALGPQEGMQ